MSNNIDSNQSAGIRRVVEHLKQLREQQFDAQEPSPNSWQVTFAIHLPDQFPGEIPYPRYFIADRVYHRGISTQELGYVAGMEYALAPHHHQEWQWCYKLYLDERSPSSAWTRWDIAWEEDLVLASSDFEGCQVPDKAEEPR